MRNRAFDEIEEEPRFQKYKRKELAELTEKVDSLFVGLAALQKSISTVEAKMVAIEDQATRDFCALTEGTTQIHNSICKNREVVQENTAKLDADFQRLLQEIDLSLNKRAEVKPTLWERLQAWWSCRRNAKIQSMEAKLQKLKEAANEQRNP